MSPEVLNFKAHSVYDASKADIWSFGITLIELLKGRPPLHYLSPRAAMAAIPRTSPPRLESDDPSASRKLRDLIHACLHDDPKKRPSASQLLKSFKSYFKHQRSLSSPVLPDLQHHLKTTSNSAVVNNTSNRKKAISETIYSQWDFDLSTLTSEASTVVKEAESKNAVTTPDSSYICVDKTVPSEPIPDIPAITPTTPHDARDTLIMKFRKLKVKNTRNAESILWDNKDSDILPIPCPSDAPDLSKPYIA